MSKYKCLAVLSFALILLTVQSSRKASALGTDLIISEYLEGSSNNKAIELFNPTDNPIDLSNYKIQSYINGSATVSAYATSSAVIGPNSTYVFCNSNSSSSILAVCNKVVSGVGTALTFNGDDAIALVKKDGGLVDVIGQIGVDPGTGWGAGLTSTQDNTLRRKCTITVGNPNGSSTFDPSIEWDGFATDTIADLGLHTLCLITQTPEPSTEPTILPTPTPSPLVSPTPTSVSTPMPTVSPVETSSPTPTPESSISPTPAPIATLSPSPRVTPLISPKPTPNGDVKHDKKFEHWIKIIANQCGKLIRHYFKSNKHEPEFNYDHWPSLENYIHFNKYHT